MSNHNQVPLVVYPVCKHPNCHMPLVRMTDYCLHHTKKSASKTVLKRSWTKCYEPNCVKMYMVNTKAGKFCTKHIPAKFINTKGVVCPFSDCLRPSKEYNIVTKEKTCSTHKFKLTEQLAKITKCTDVKCANQAQFRDPISKIDYCAIHSSYHARTGAADCKRGRCASEGCKIYATFRDMYDNQIYCFDHKPINFVRIGKITCAFNTCTKTGIHILDNRSEKYCREHLDIMSGTRNCSHNKCENIARFGIKNTIPTHCDKHKSRLHFQFKKIQCMYNNCTNPAKFKEPQSQIWHCTDHKSDSAHISYARYCRYPGCFITANYGENNERTHCSSHKSKFAVNVSINSFQKRRLEKTYDDESDVEPTKKRRRIITDSDDEAYFINELQTKKSYNPILDGSDTDIS